MRRSPLSILILLVVAALFGFAGGKASSWQATPVDSAAPAPTITVSIVRRDVSDTISLDGRITHTDAPWPLTNRLGGVVTGESDIGSIRDLGQLLYSVDSRPVFLTVGSVPLWRPITIGASGPDVDEVKAALDVLLGTAALRTGRAFSWWESAQIRQWQADRGFATSDSSIPLGEFIAEPAPILIAGNKARIGATVGDGQEILIAKSIKPQVSAITTQSVAAVLQPDQKVRISIGSSTLSGHVTKIDVVSQGSAGSPNQNSTAVEVAIDDEVQHALADGSAAQVNVTLAEAKSVLTVPIAALLALAEGGYGVEVVEASGSVRLVPVKVGLIDDVGGIAEISGAGISEGLHIRSAQG